MQWIAQKGKDADTDAVEYQLWDAGDQFCANASLIISGRNGMPLLIQPTGHGFHSRPTNFNSGTLRVMKDAVSALPLVNGCTDAGFFNQLSEGGIRCAIIDAVQVDSLVALPSIFSSHASLD